MKRFSLLLLAAATSCTAYVPAPVQERPGPLRFSFSCGGRIATKASMLVEVPSSVSLFSVGDGAVDDILTYDEGCGLWVSGKLYASMEARGNLVALAPLVSLDRTVSAFAYSPSSDVLSQVDLVGASVCDVTCTGSGVTSCRLEHLLCCVDFTLSPGLSDAEIMYVKVSGVFDGATWTLQDGRIAISHLSGATSEFRTDFASSSSGKLMMIPQTLPPSAILVLGISVEGDEYELRAALAGQEWEAGKHLTYRLNWSSAVFPELLFDLTISDWESVQSEYSEYL